MVIMFIFWAIMIVILYRVSWVSENRIKILIQDFKKSMQNITETELPYFPNYNKLPSYHIMLLKFWIWNIEKFKV